MTADQLEKVRFKLDEFMTESVADVKSRGKYSPEEAKVALDLRATILGVHEAVANACLKGANVDAVLGALMGYTMVFAAARKGRV